MRFLPLTSLDGAFFEKFPLFSNFLRKLLPDPGRPSGGRCTAACNKGLPPRGKAPAGGCGARRPGAPSPLGRGGLRPPGLAGCRPAGGGVPPGGKTISFSAEKETVLHPKEKEGPVYGALMQRKRRLAALRTVVRTSPGRYGHPMVEQGWFLVLSCGRLALPLSGPGWSGNPSAAHRGTRERRASFVGRDALPPHSAARVAPPGGGWIELPSFPCSTMAWP